MKKQKLLYIDTPFLGFKGGDKNRSNFLYESLSTSFELDTLLVCDKKYEKEEIFRHKTDNELFTIKASSSNFFTSNAVFGFSKQELEKFIDIISKNSYDVIFFRFCSASKLAYKIEEVLPFCKVIVDVDMLFSRINNEAWKSNKTFKNRYYFFESIKSHFFEKSFFSKDFTFLYTNKEEIELVKKTYKNINNLNHKLLPNVIKEVNNLSPKQFESSTILFFGALNSTANETAYTYLINEIYPLIKDELITNNIVIKIVGKSKTKVYDKAPLHIEIIGEVEDINSYIKSVDLIFLPLKVASGTRTRILETANIKKPVLCTSIAAEGLGMEDCLFIEDDTKKLAFKLLSLLKDKNQMNKVALKSYDFVQKYYLDKNVAKNLYEIINEAKKEINIVHIPRRFSQKSWGGTENVIVSHLSNLKDFAINQEVFTSRILENKKEEKLYGAKIKRFKYFYPYLNLSSKSKKSLDLVGGNIFSFSMFFTLLFKKNLHLVHLHTAKRFGSIARAVCKLRKIPYVITVHGGVFNTISSSSIKIDLTSKAFEWGKVLGFLCGSRRVYEDANAVICLNKIEYDAMKSRNKNTFFLPNSIDVKNFENKKVENKKFKFLISARIDKQKNQLLVLQALQELQNPKISLVIAGNITDESYFYTLKEFVKTNSLENQVEFFTALKPNSKELLDIYSSCDAMILPSIHEPFGLVVLEAWASSLPVILSDIAGIKDAIFHEKNALLFKNKSLDSLHFQMKLLLEDETLQKNLRANGYKTVQDYDDKKISSKLVDIYKKAFI